MGHSQKYISLHVLHSSVGRSTNSIQISNRKFIWSQNAEMVLFNFSTGRTDAMVLVSLSLLSVKISFNCSSHILPFLFILIFNSFSNHSLPTFEICFWPPLVSLHSLIFQTYFSHLISWRFRILYSSTLYRPFLWQKMKIVWRRKKWNWLACVRSESLICNIRSSCLVSGSC